MNARLVRQLIGLYPPAWRVRYGEEFQEFLEAHSSNFRTILNVVRWAIYERSLSLMNFKMELRQHSVILMVYAYLAAIAAGVNFYWTVADTPLATAMQFHSALFASWNLVRGASLLALVAVAMVGIPVCVAMVRAAFDGHRWNILYRLAVAPSSVAIILMWLVTGTKLAGGHWVPTPWDVTGDWVAPQHWPALSTRWSLGSVTFVLMIVGLIFSAVCLREAIRRTDLSKLRRFWFKASSVLLAASVALMALGVLTWGFFVQQYAASEFHARNGGLFSSTNFASWAACCTVFLAATVVAIRSARSALILTTE
jgi:hypothetical protein